MTLNPRQARFVQEYLVDLNATQAATRAGYSPKTAFVQGCQLLTNPKVAAAVALAQEARAQRTGVTQDAVLEELLILLKSNVRDYEVSDLGELVLHNGASEDAWRAVSSVKHRIRTDEDGVTTREIEYRLWDKPAALRLAAQHLGMLTERMQLEVLEKLSDDELAQIARGKMKVA